MCCSCAVPLAIFVVSTTQLDKRAHRNRKAKYEQITHKCRRTCGTCEVQLHTSPPMNKYLDWFQREPFEHSQTRHTNSASTFSGGNYKISFLRFSLFSPVRSQGVGVLRSCLPASLCRAPVGMPGFPRTFWPCNHRMCVIAKETGLSA